MKKARTFILVAFLAAFIMMGAAAPSNTVHAAPDNTYIVNVATGYLALRTEPAFDSRNEIGKLYNGDKVEVCEYTSGGYWWVYSPKYDRYGYVNNDYLYSASSQSSSSDYGSYTVSVATGYLALRNAPYYDSSNEIGKLYSGDTVTVKEKTYSDYWWVYSPKYNRSGYVDCQYIFKEGSSGSSYSYNNGPQFVVTLDGGYLALRDAPVYSKGNELGRLYNGDVVNLEEKTNDKYWYVYSPKLDLYGYVNQSYLTGGYICNMTVRVNQGYLALRSAMAYDSSNEIGALYSGDTVQVIEKSSKTYWYVYSPKLDKYGYVNKAYLK